MVADAARAESGDSSDPRSRLRSALSATTGRLSDAGVPSPSVDARALISRAAGEPGHLALVDELPDRFEEELEALLLRREAREPLQLILGTAPFRRRDVLVRAGVFVPRPETEVAIDLLLAHLGAGAAVRILDLCTGSGALAAAVLDELPRARVTAVELDPGAADLAWSNIQAVDPLRGEVLRGDVREMPLPGPVAAILANPPYIPSGQIPRDPEVLEHDPPLALYGGGQDGLEIPRAIIHRAGSLLDPGGLLVMEHADVQGGATRAIAEDTGAFADIRTAKDLTGRDRFLVAVAHRTPRREVRD